MSAGAEGSAGERNQRGFGEQPGAGRLVELRQQQPARGGGIEGQGAADVPLLIHDKIRGSDAGIDDHRIVAGVGRQGGGAGEAAHEHQKIGIIGVEEAVPVDRVIGDLQHPQRREIEIGAWVLLDIAQLDQRLQDLVQGRLGDPGLGMDLDGGDVVGAADDVLQNSKGLFDGDNGIGIIFVFRHRHHAPSVCVFMIPPNLAAVKRQTGK